jgi:hypothetical protein
VQNGKWRTLGGCNVLVLLLGAHPCLVQADCQLMGYPCWSCTYRLHARVAGEGGTAFQALLVTTLRVTLIAQPCSCKVLAHVLRPVVGAVLWDRAPPLGGLHPPHLPFVHLADLNFNLVILMVLKSYPLPFAQILGDLGISRYKMDVWSTS